MRLVLVNPHTQNFGKSVAGVLLRRKDFLKYDYFVDFFIKRKGKNVAFLIDGTRTSFSGIGLSSFFSWKSFAWLELVLWMLLNGINPSRVKVYFDVSELDSENDILFDFSRSIVDINDQKKLSLNRFQGITIIHFTHYFKDVKTLADYIRTIPRCVVVAENDLMRNPFFRKYFDFVREVYHLPFAYGERFVVRNEFEGRVNKCLALGSITRIKNKDFLEFFGDSEGLHPMRKRIYGSPADCEKEIDCLIHGFNDTLNVREIEIGDSILVRLAKKHLPFFLLEKLYPTPQIAYFKFDIVEKLNAYKMFLCSEESVGLPSINVFEGMATQNVYVGIDDSMYTTLGMKPGIHYIGYKENDLEDLLEKIRHYQANPDKLYEIARDGYAFVRKHFSRKNVADVFWYDLERLSRDFHKSGSCRFLCSFKKN
jgi:glycosyltransferase involved in cell wall biosynthesis